MGRREFGRQMFEKEQIQIKLWRETCDRAGRGRAGIADKEQEGREKRTKGWWESVRCHTVTGGGFLGLVPVRFLWFLWDPWSCASGAEQRGAWQNRGMGIVETREVDPPGRGRGMRHGLGREKGSDVVGHGKGGRGQDRTAGGTMSSGVESWWAPWGRRR